MTVLHEMYGIQAEQLETLRVEYAKLIALLQRLKDGEVKLDDIVIDGNGWSIRPDKPIDKENDDG